MFKLPLTDFVLCKTKYFQMSAKTSRAAKQSRNSNRNAVKGWDRLHKEGDVVLRLNMLKCTKKGHKSEDTRTGPYKVLPISIIIWMLSPAVYQNKQKLRKK